MIGWLRRPSLAKRIAFGFFLAYALILLAFVQAMRLVVFENDVQLGADIALETTFADLAHTGERLALAPDAEVLELAQRQPDLWFVARRDGQELAFGAVPPSARPFLDAAPGILKIAEIRMAGGRGDAANASLDRRETEYGFLTVIAGGVDSASVGQATYMLFVYRFGLIWAVAALALVGLIAVTLIVPLVLRGVRPLAREAARLDPQELSRRLPEGAVPQELLPIVRAFNAALDRLSEAFERRRRFIADVAHELRTPLAVLNMHVEALAPGGSKPDLQRGVYRLGQMVGQMLDAERLTLAARQREPVDLVELVRESVADVAPLAVASGYEIAVATEADALVVEADRHALARAIGNLLGNAIAHGGNAGLIEARIARSGFIEVADEGPGVPPEARERIFEPFGRERWDRDGCGLGLHLVREIMAAHGGRVELARSRGGATFRLVFQVGAA